MLLNDVITLSPEDEVSDDNSDHPWVQASLEMQKISTEEASLVWWEKNTFHYPLLSNITQRYLIIKVPSEWVFSAAGHIISQKCDCLLPKNVRMLVFVAEIFIKFHEFSVPFPFTM